MRNVKKLLAALLVATMLFSANGFTYAAETTESPVMQEEEVVDDSSSDSDEEEEAAVEEEPAEEDSGKEEALTEEGSESQSDAAAEEETDKESSEEAAQPGTEDAASSETDGSDQQAQDTSAQDASADETTDAAQTEETTAAAEEEPVFTAGQLEAKGKDYEVLLTYEADAEIPDGAELKVEELKQDSDEYKECLKETESAVEKGIAEARFFDITIWKDGQEIQPKENSTVRVNITYKKEAIEVAEEDNGEVQAVHFEDGMKDAKVLDTKTNEGSEVKDIEFDTKSFSIFGVIYTVDFTYDGYTFSIPGEGTILLSALAEQLNLAEKNFALENVKEVTFSNNELLKIEKQEDDWLLTSLKAFSTEETLTILMADGSKFLIVVTDAQENSYDVIINFTNKDQTAPVTPDLTGQYSFVKAGLYNKDGERIGYIFKRVSINSSSTTVNLDSFKLDDGRQISYADAKAAEYYVDGIRLAHTTNQWDDPNNLNYSQYVEKINNADDPMTEGDYDAYTFVSNRRDNYVDPDHTGDPKTATYNTITIREADPVVYKVKVDCGDDPLKIPSDTDIYAKVKIEYQSGAVGWGIGKVTFTEGESTAEVTINDWYLQMQSWVPTYTPVDDIRISTHENKVSVVLAGVPSGTVVSSPADLDNTVEEGGTVQTHNVESYPDIPKDYVPTGITPPQRIIENLGDSTVITDIVYLAKNNDKLDDTSLEYLLNNYNIVTLCTPENGGGSYNGATWKGGDFYDNNHTIGAVLIRGDLIPGVSITNIGTGSHVHSAIGGRVPTPNSVDGGLFGGGQGGHGSVDNLYIGSVNTVIGKVVNGHPESKPYNSNGAVIVSDNFVNWETLSSSIQTQSSSMLSNSTRFIDTSTQKKVLVNVGEHVELSDTDGVTVVICGEPGINWTEAKGTVISCAKTGDG